MTNWKFHSTLYWLIFPNSISAIFHPRCHWKRIAWGKFFSMASLQELYAIISVFRWVFELRDAPSIQKCDRVFFYQFPFSIDDCVCSFPHFSIFSIYLLYALLHILLGELLFLEEELLIGKSCMKIFHIELHVWHVISVGGWLKFIFGEH